MTHASAHEATCVHYAPHAFHDVRVNACLIRFALIFGMVVMQGKEEARTVSSFLEPKWTAWPERPALPPGGGVRRRAMQEPLRPFHAPHNQTVTADPAAAGGA